MARPAARAAWQLSASAGQRRCFSKSCFGAGKCPLESPFPIRPFLSLVEVPAASSKQDLPSFTARCKKKLFLSLILLLLLSFGHEEDGRRASTLNPAYSFLSFMHLSPRAPKTRASLTPSLYFSAPRQLKEEADVFIRVEKQMICAAAAQTEAIPREPTWKAAPCFP